MPSCTRCASSSTGSSRVKTRRVRARDARAGVHATRARSSVSPTEPRPTRSCSTISRGSAAIRRRRARRPTSSTCRRAAMPTRSRGRSHRDGWETSLEASEGAWLVVAMRTRALTPARRPRHAYAARAARRRARRRLRRLGSAHAVAASNGITSPLRLRLRTRSPAGSGTRPAARRPRPRRAACRPAPTSGSSGARRPRPGCPCPGTRRRARPGGPTP